MRFLFITVTLLSLLSCRSTKDKQKDQLCEKNIEFVRNHIYADNSKGAPIFFFKGNPYPEVELIRINSYLISYCFEGWRKKEVRALLGAPTEDFSGSGKNKWWYFLINEECGLVGKECTIWEFYFDKRDRVSRFVSRTLNEKVDWQD